MEAHRRTSMATLGQILLATLFFTTWALDSFVFCATTIEARVSLGLRLPLAGVNWLAAFYLLGRSRRIITGEMRDALHVVRASVYGIVRHPMYLGEILLYPGFLLWRFSAVACVIWLVGIGFLHGLARYEERILLTGFKDEYRDYMRDVPMWLPWIWS